MSDSSRKETKRAVFSESLYYNAVHLNQGKVNPQSIGPRCCDFLTLDPDRHAEYILQQTLISNIRESYNMPKLVDGCSTPKIHATRSKLNSESNLNNTRNRESKANKSANKMAEYGNTGLGNPNFPHVELEEGDKIITSKQRKDPGAIIDALNQIHYLVRTNQSALVSQRNHFEERFSQLDTRIDNINLNLDSAHQKLTEHGKDIHSLKSEKANKSELKSLENSLTQMKDSFNNKFETTEKQHTSLLMIIKEQQIALKNMELEMKRMAYNQSEIKERVNVLEMNNKHLHLTIENIPEAKNQQPAEATIQRLNLDIENELSTDLIKTAYRMGKFNPKAKYPRPIKVIVVDDKARSSILACSGKLKPNKGNTIVWINETYPEEYRRRKTMMRDLVKKINQSGDHAAAIEAGGIKLDGQLYMPDQFSEMPRSCQPDITQSVNTDNGGLAFCGEWVSLSNMFRCSFMYEETLYHSAEQCYQHQKALSHGKYSTADRILINNNPFDCKRLGDDIEDNKAWKESREETLYDICRCKFVQNEDLLDKLHETGDKKLFEATKSAIWGTGSTLKSQETKEEKGQGDNVFGKILERLRAELK